MLRGKDVLKEKLDLLQQVRGSRLTHWAPNCATFSRAREIPIKGVRSPPAPLRSEAFPEGIPGRLEGMSKKAKSRLVRDTIMANMAAEEALRAHERGGLFTLENPARSLALELPSWKKLLCSPGVQAVFYTNCMFPDSRRRKNQVLICNSPAFRPMGRVCGGAAVCDRTGERHLRWRPAVSGGKVIQFTTGDEREYTRGFCEAYAECCSSIRPAGNFVEVFSGPNAPLSEAVCRAEQVPLPGVRLQTQRGVRNELQTLAEVVEGAPPVARRSTPGVPPVRESRPVEIGAYCLPGVEAGRQPSYGKRTQLIADGLNDELKHLELALRLAHPFRQLTSLKQDHCKALDGMQRILTRANESRLRTLAQRRLLAKDPDVVAAQAEHEVEASVTAKRLGRKPRTALMGVLAARYGIEDDAIPKLCLTGLPTVG